MVHTETAGRATDRYVRPALLVLAVVVLLGASAIFAGSVRLALAGAVPDRPLPPDRGVTDSGIAVPASAQRCEAQAVSETAEVRWCLPSQVTQQSLAGWYAATLPTGRDTAGLRWCMQQHLADGVRRSVWFDGSALVGYGLPSPSRHGSVQPVDEGLAVTVFRVPATGCPPPTRSSYVP